ncbi:MAG: tRNA 2-selenouridine(34) synthase MnmH [Cyclobacteriaceae bacterium]
MDKVDVGAFLEKREDFPIIDVRSPGEFQKGHIPSAISIPLFTNEERAVVGMLYKQQGQQAAIKEGLHIVGPKMVDFINQAESTGASHLHVHCWRGGMRSESMAWLFERYGLQTTLLNGGYKAYRTEVLRYFDQPLNLRVLTGYTGCQKTELLQTMARQGAQVIDLEGLANHQGSSFGNAKTDGQPTSEQFQNNLHAYCLTLDPSRPIWIEDESICIGSVSLPESLFEQMSLAPHVRISAAADQRLQFLVKDYGEVDPEKLKASTMAITKRLGKESTQQALIAIDKGDLYKAASLVLGYYDKQYEKSISKKSKSIIADFTLKSDQLESLATELINHKACQ